ncbi:conserved protein of unknown function (plasmid) [Cupriavidus taiwanensis]|uniref:Uncharacterized protein n=1 Tax=Cupriavidus taiwanensis TaxID=164546 RepID=A0A375IRL8_9BURK|nr:hypothetical protein [Cupriavidus taiwanensis]SPK77207.1 conserved protein of unknown function [Cupriavidus taiwanensis]
MRTKSQRYIDALAQLPQFMPALLEPHKENRVINALTGAIVQAIPDPDDEEHENIQVAFPGGQPFEAVAPMYLHLQVVEAARYYADSAEDGSGAISKRAADMLEHLTGKHDL